MLGKLAGKKREFRASGEASFDTIFTSREADMQISLRELVDDPAKYVLLADTQDIYIIQEGKGLAKLTSIKSDKTEIAKSLFGILPQDVDVTAIKDECLS
ncbi:MAG: hypothetical protein K2N07_09795 [Desulfovibrio sp.]|nr:hypothetical protein [Desulfovibrio sp.]